jgi:UrcA family protein
MRSLKPAILATAFAMTVLGSPAAWCKPPEPKYNVVGRVHVPLADLNLNDPTDIRTLLERLDAAAYDACGGDPKLHNSYRRSPEKTIAVYEECRTNAVKRVVDQMSVPALTRAYADTHRPHPDLACNTQGGRH